MLFRALTRHERQQDLLLVIGSRSSPTGTIHLPNFILAALMYTLLGRALLALIVGPDSLELHLAVLLPRHRSCGRGGSRR